MISSESFNYVNNFYQYPNNKTPNWISLNSWKLCEDWAEEPCQLNKCRFLDQAVFPQILKGEEAPLLSQLKDWMETHPGWEVLSDSEDSGDDSQDDDGTAQPTTIWHVF